MSAEVESEVAGSSEQSAAFQRVLLKLSGEALLGRQQYGIDLGRVEAIAAQVKDVHELGVETALVLGAGNIYRGMEAAAEGMVCTRCTISCANSTNDWLPLAPGSNTTPGKP